MKVVNLYCTCHNSFVMTVEYDQAEAVKSRLLERNSDFVDLSYGKPYERKRRPLHLTDEPWNESVAILFKADRWDVLYVDRKRLFEGHELTIEGAVQFLFDHHVTEFHQHIAVNDIPKFGDPLVEFWFNDPEKPDEWQYGWWDFPSVLTEDQWRKYAR